jgi:hypothetical protein
MVRNGMADTIMEDVHGLCLEIQGKLRTAGWDVAIEDVWRNLGTCYLWTQSEVTLVRLIGVMTGDHIANVEELNGSGRPADRPAEPPERVLDEPAERQSAFTMGPMGPIE